MSQTADAGETPAASLFTVHIDPMILQWTSAFGFECLETFQVRKIESNMCSIQNTEQQYYINDVRRN